MVKGLLVIVLAVFLFWWLAVPALEGYHIGVDATTDHCQMTRLGLQWGKSPSC